MASNVKNGTTTISCTCQHKFQDETYGKGKRLANLTLKGARCTVCGFESKSIEKPKESK